MKLHYELTDHWVNDGQMNMLSLQYQSMMHPRAFDAINRGSKRQTYGHMEGRTDRPTSNFWDISFKTFLKKEHNRDGIPCIFLKLLQTKRSTG